ncbi:unnamed protein product [Ceutorhynchus assimilis]|uniref:FLYWCH-type domain-containing protein n=1 Tax=Ceutorhynchus assimilis TaxID=467358 RepID=A0A9N9MQQ3_9CUCU|nr:unnamed protein product [Ceutorhynchus assimilis]
MATNKSSELIETISQRGRTLLVKNKFKYREESRKIVSGETKWTCIKDRCTAYLRTIGDRDHRVVTGKREQHFHEPDPDCVLKRQLLNQLVKKKVKSEITENPSHLTKKILAEEDSTSATGRSNARLDLPIPGPLGQGAEPSDTYLELPSTSNEPETLPKS